MKSTRGYKTIRFAELEWIENAATGVTYTIQPVDINLHWFTRIKWFLEGFWRGTTLRERCRRIVANNMTRIHVDQIDAQEVKMSITIDGFD